MPEKDDSSSTGVSYPPADPAKAEARIDYTRETLGGARKSSPLDNVLSYPITAEEYLTITEMIPATSFTNVQSMWLTSAIAFGLAAASLFLTTSFYHENGGDQIIDWRALLFTAGMCAASIICAVSFVVVTLAKKSSSRSYQRLDRRIRQYLSIREDEEQNA